MEKNKTHIFLEFKNLKIVFSAFNSKFENKYRNTINIDFFNKDILQDLSVIIREQIIKIEKEIGHFINEINIILDLNKSINIKLNIFKKKENSKITYDDIKYLIQDARQQIVEQNKDLTILHIYLENFYINKIKKIKILNSFNADDFSVNLNFICYPKHEIADFKNLLVKNQIKINKFICNKYLESFMDKSLPRELQSSHAALKTIMGLNENEVQMVPKIIKNKGFFERIFKFFIK